MDFDPFFCFCLQNVLDVISLVSRINFTKTTSFNLVLFTKVDDVKTVKEKMKEGGVADTQTAHFYVQNLPQRRESTGNNYSDCRSMQMTFEIAWLDRQLLIISLFVKEESVPLSLLFCFSFCIL